MESGTRRGDYEYGFLFFFIIAGGLRCFMYTLPGLPDLEKRALNEIRCFILFLVDILTSRMLLAFCCT